MIETDGVLLTDKEHLEEALRAATYVIPIPNHQVCEVLSPDLAKAAEIEFTRQIEADALVGWRQKLNRPAHEVAVGIWLAGLPA